MLDQNHPLSRYEKAFRENSLVFSGFNFNAENNTIDSFMGGCRDTSPTNIEMTVDLSFKAGNLNIQNLDTLFFLMLNALFEERYGMKIKEFEDMYPEIVI